MPNPRDKILRTVSSDIDEPVAKRRRLAASEFLEVLEPNNFDKDIENSNEITIIPQDNSKDVNTSRCPTSGSKTSDKETDLSINEVMQIISVRY